MLVLAAKAKAVSGSAKASAKARGEAYLNQISEIIASVEVDASASARAKGSAHAHWFCKSSYLCYIDEESELEILDLL